jgi:D-inositol-3-phosphate glycosyltransferase
MRIAIISEHASPLASLGGIDSGGQNVYVGQLSRSLSLRGHTVDIFTRRDDPRQRDSAHLSDTLRVIHVAAGPPCFIKKERMFPYMDEFTDSMRALFCKAEPYDVMHANFWMSGYVAMRLKQSFHLPFVITFHALGKVRRIYQQKQDGFPDIRFDVEQKIMDSADAIIAECPQDRSDMLDLYRVDPSKIVMVPCGHSHEEFEPMPKTEARRRLGWGNQDRIILHIGRIVPRKGIETVIHGFSHFIKSSPEKRRSRLVIVGGNGLNGDLSAEQEIERLRAIATRLDVADAVLFTGHVERNTLKLYYNGADVFVTTPWYEPFGITPVESMACGTPVIGSNVGGIKYTVRHGVTGYLIPSKDSAALHQTLNAFFADPERISSMSRQAVRQARRFTWERIADMVGPLYTKVCSDAPCRRVLG